MKFSINKSDILDVLSKIQGITGRKSNLAITENILIRTSGDGIQLIATDLESGFEGFYPAKVETEGIIVIPARKFYEIVREFPSEEIHVHEAENHWVEIGNKNVQYHIVGMNPEEFPETPQLEDVVFSEIDSILLKKMIEKTVIISGASDDKRPHINGVYFEVLDGDQKETVVRMVATDGSRLSLADYTNPEDFSNLKGSGMIIPKKGLAELSKFLDPEGVVQIGFKNNKFIVKKSNQTIIIRLLEGDFPKYHDIIVKGDGHIIAFKRQIFLMMLKRMSILSSEMYKGVIFKFEDNGLTVTTTNPDIGESKEEISIDFSGKKIEAMFNPKFFIDTLNVIDDDVVVLHIENEEKPCIIEGEKEKNYLSVIMPMKI
jgi:DNA polymerase III subunit beta